MSSKLLLDTLRLADGGHVVCDATLPDGSVVPSVIERSFFEDFMGVPNPVLTAQKQSRIVEDNLTYLEGEVERQWRLGSRSVVIR